MEILFISHKYPPATGGMEKFSYELISGVQQHIKVHKVVYDGKESRLMWFLKLRRRVDTLIIKHPCIKLIHLNDGLMTYFCLWLKKKYRLPVVATLHGLDVVFPLPYYQKKILPQFNKIDGFACVSRATQAAAIDRDIRAVKTVVIPNGVDLVLFSSRPDEHMQQQLRERYGLGAEKKLLIGLGRAVRRKGYSWFVREVLPSLDDDVVFIHCGPSSNYTSEGLQRFFPERWIQMFELMMGLPTDESALQEEAKRQPTRFIKTGYLPFAEVIQLMKMSGIFIMPNLEEENDMEGFGLVALEACLAGCEVFASAIDGITDAIIDGENGHLLPAGNQAAWVHGIKMRLSSEKDTETIRRFQAYTMKNYSWDTMCSTYLNWFKGIIKQQEEIAPLPNTAV